MAMAATSRADDATHLHAHANVAETTQPRDTLNDVAADDEDVAADAFLPDVFTLYFHHPGNESWTLESYEQVASVATAGEAWALMQGLARRDACAEQGMLFVMRDGIFPVWDDAMNIEAGCLSMRVPLERWPEEFAFGLLSRLLGGQLGRAVNGVSSSPRTGHCLVKLWLAADAPQDAASYGAPPDAFYRSNRDLIANNNSRMQAGAARGGGCQK